MKIESEIIEKIRKLLILAGDKAAHAGEIETAMVKAKELARRHAIDIASVDLNQESESNSIEVEKDSSLKTRSKFRQPYHRYIFWILKQVFEVHVVLSGHSTMNGQVIEEIHLIGDPTDIAIAKVIFPFLEAVFPRTLSRFVRDGTLTYRTAHMNGCYHGLAIGIITANKKQEEALPKEDRSKWALIVVKKTDVIQRKMKELFPDMREGRRSSIREQSSHAMSLGFREGSKLNLNQIKGK